MNSKRGPIPHANEPMRAGHMTLQTCRDSIDGKLKSYIRVIVNFLYKRRCRISEVGEGVQFGKGVRIPRGSRLGNFCYIGSGFSSPSPVVIGDLCMISTSVSIVGSDHGIDDPYLSTRLDFRWEHKVTTFELDSWVGHGAVLRAGITIGIGSVVAAGAVVVKNVPPNTVVGGNPARKIRDRFDPEDWQIYLQKLTSP